MRFNTITAICSWRELNVHSQIFPIYIYFKIFFFCCSTYFTSLVWSTYSVIGQKLNGWPTSTKTKFERSEQQQQRQHYQSSDINRLDSWFTTDNKNTFLFFLFFDFFFWWNRWIDRIENKFKNKVLPPHLLEITLISCVKSFFPAGTLKCFAPAFTFYA